jgi:RNA polymerase sigma-70 factor (ECF subfamily)
LDPGNQNRLYEEVRGSFGTALQRLARGYESDHDRRQDLLQEIHLAVWRSLRLFNGACSLRTWVYRVAHNTGATHVIRDRRTSARLVDLESIDPAVRIASPAGEHHVQVARILELIHQLRPVDRQIMLLYLEGESAGSVAEVTGLSASNVATKIHRIKRLLQQQIRQTGEEVDERSDRS